MGAVSAASGCSVGGSQWEPVLSVADGLLEPLDCQVHVNDMSKFGASLSCGYAQASVAGRGGLCVVTAGLSVCAVPIVGLCHHCWGEGIPLMWDYDLATVDCWQSHSTCHCLQQSRQFGLGVSKVCTGVGVARGRVSCSTVRVPAWGAGGGGAEGGSSSGTDETSCCRTAAEPARPLTITVCAGRWGGGGCGGGSGGGAGLSGERLGRELAEWRSQGSELAEWRSQARELAESAAGCRTVKSGCRTVPAQAVHISTHWDLELWVSPERGCSPVEVRLCIVSLASVSQCSLFLCFSRGLLQRTSQGAGLAMGQWVVERWPTMHSNSASKMGAARNWVLRGDCRAETGFLSGSTLCSRTRGVLQAEGRVRLWQWSDQLVLMDSQCGVQPHWPRPPPVYKGPQQWDDGAQRREQVENLEVAGGSWEAMLLAILSQLYMALATRARGAAGSGRRWRRERRRARNSGNRGGKGGTAVQQWWRNLRSTAHLDRCGHRGSSRWKSNAKQEEFLEVQNLEGAGTGSSTPTRSSNRSSVSKGVCWRRGYRVLGVVLLWLVVPAEATSGGASALEGAALAATAAGIGAAVTSI